MKEKATRKVVPTLIEANGRNGVEAKKHIGPDYRTGIVIPKDERVAVWTDEAGKGGHMRLMGAMLQ